MEGDLEVLKQQLGREPRNLVRVETRCPGGYPQVVTTAPLLDSASEPGIFPTTYWLTCPELNYRISQLENQGWIKEFELKIEQNNKLARKLEEAHQNYIQDRLKLISDKKLKYVQTNFPGQFRVLTKSGVGGILKSKGLKCLHTHYAHYLADKNPIGRLVDDLLADNYSDLNPEDCRYHCDLEGSN